mgnify:CR=1 FL=1
MGQRSQIYIRYKTETGYRLIANYYQWNYGEHMISRARYGIEWLDQFREYYRWWFRDNEEKIRRYFDVNFDDQDIVMHHNINEEFEQDMNEAYCQDVGLNQYAFQMQDNNDGKLLIDVTESEIRYAFLDWSGSETSLMTPTEYMNWDDVGWRWNGYTDQGTCLANIKALESYPLMTREQVYDMLTCQYENDPTIPLF